MLKMFRASDLRAGLSLVILAAAALSACVPSDSSSQDSENMTSNEAYHSDQQKELRKKELYFPFGIEKTCGNAYPRLKLANVKESPQQGSISLWETHSNKANIARYVLWNEIRACGFLIETPAENGEGPFIDEAYVLLDDMSGGSSVPNSSMTIEGVKFKIPAYEDSTGRDREIVQEIYQEKFLECRAKTDSSKTSCRDEAQDWMSKNTAVLTIAFNGAKQIETANLFMIDDRMWWAGREIK